MSVSRRRDHRARLPQRRLSFVEPLEPRALLTTFNVSSLADDGVGSLRKAINDANGASGADTITFTVTGAIKPLSQLPDVSEATIFDGTTVPGFAGKPMVAIDGSQAYSISGLVLMGDGCTVKSLAFINCQGAAGYVVAGLVVASSNNTIIGNFFGVDPAGTTANPNSRGILVTPNAYYAAVAGNTIGGSTAAARNIISGNIGDGVAIAGASNTIVIGNYIGVDFSGTAAVPNGGNGVSIDSYSPIVFSAVLREGGGGNTIGRVTTGEGNRIRYNGGAGVNVVDGVGNGGVSGNTIRGNSMVGNGSLGINLVDDGVVDDAATANDKLDPDGGPNKLQNFPLVAGVSAASNSVSVGGMLNGLANTTCTIDAYASSAADSSGYGEGSTWLGSTTVTTDAFGNATWFIQHGGAVSAGSFITAVATDPGGNSSEFSAAVAMPAVGTPATLRFVDPAPYFRENAGVAEVIVARSGDLSVSTQVTFTSTSDTAKGGSDFSARGGKLTFAPNETFKVIQIPLISDAIYEVIERFDVKLSNVVDGQLSGPNPAQVVIDDVLYDSRFGSGGTTTQGTSGTYTDNAQQVLVLPDGKVLVGGTGGASGFSKRFELAKFNANGSVDTTFGVNGRVAVQAHLGAHPDDRFRSFTVQSDGKTVVVGYTSILGHRESDSAIVRLNANGTLDTSFGNGGRVVQDFGSSYSPDEAATSVLQLANGKLMVAGGARENFYLARLNANGMLDTTFQGTGIVFADIVMDRYDTATNLLVQSDGKFVLAGNAGGSIDAGNFAAARFKADGTLDTSYSGDGMIVLGNGAKMSRAALDSQGRLVMAGLYRTYYGKRPRITLPWCD